MGGEAFFFEGGGGKNDEFLDDEMEELLAIGGDPTFLEQARGGSGEFEWDGVEDDAALGDLDSERVARVVAETAEATQIHDADGDQRATRAAHAVKLRIACSAPTARPASPVNVVDEALAVDSVPRTPAVRVLGLVE